MRRGTSSGVEARVAVIRRLMETDARAYRAVLVEALILHPDRFVGDYHAEISRPLIEIEQQLVKEAVFGAWIREELVGIVCFVSLDIPKRRHAGALKNFYVKERFREKGIAGLLLGVMLEYARRRVDQVELIVSARNEDAIRFFERHGFRLFGLMPRGLRIEGEDYDTWTMVLILR